MRGEDKATIYNLARPYGSLLQMETWSLQFRLLSKFQEGHDDD